MKIMAAIAVIFLIAGVLEGHPAVACGTFSFLSGVGMGYFIHLGLTVARKLDRPIDFTPAAPVEPVGAVQEA